MTQTVSTMSKSLADENRSRDVRRRIEVIHKKLADLQELGIPCAFCYSSARNTGSIFTLGDSRITDVIERHKNEILVHLSGDNPEQTEGNSSKEIHLILPPLPSPLEEISRQTLQSLIVGIIKDLGLKWTDSTPSWWPLDIPFVHPRSLPQTYYGNLVQALRKILESVYSYFSYDVTKYIASRLEHESESPTITGEVARIQPQAQLDPDSDKEGESSNLTTDVPSSKATVEKKPPTKVISNFTVENILMGPQHSSSGSSHSPSSTSTGSSQTSPVEYSSILPGNWISHPPVKYTKYTMLSPGSMVEDKTKKKSKTETLPVVNSRPRHHSSSVEASPGLSESHKLAVRRVPSNPVTRVPSGEQLHSSYPAQSHSGSNGHQTTRLSSTEESKPLLSTSLTQSHAMLSRSVSTLPVIQAIPYSSPGGKAVLQQSFPPSQQFVLLVPSTSTNIGEGLQAVVYTNQNQTQLSANTQSTTKPAISRPSEHAPEASSPSNDTDKRLLELAYRPIAPKNKTIFKDMTPISTLSSTPPIEKKGYKRSPSVTKPQKLRFHMTTVVKRPKHSSMMTSSMTVESPSTIASERTKTTSFILDPQPSAETLAEKHITKTKNSYSAEKLVEDVGKPERAEASPQSVASDDPVTHHPNEPNNDHSVSRHTHSLHKDPPETKKDKFTFVQFHEDKQFDTPNDIGRTTRSYTRRKRELTFHLYEDPETAFKTKRNCKE